MVVKTWYGRIGQEAVAGQHGRNTPHHLPYRDCYKIEDMRQSECSWVLFVSHAVTKQVGVLKILKRYEDTRYALDTVQARQQCMREALCINRTFSPPIYRGLARVERLDLQRKQVITGELIEEPASGNIDPTAEYALVMHQIKDDRRLDYLLSDAKRKQKISLLGHYKQLLLNRIIYMHRHQAEVSRSREGEPEWGSFEQLRVKLEGNLELLENAFVKSKHGLDSYVPWFEEQKSILPRLLRGGYKHCFADRVQGEHIRHCHGDLKTPNIMIEPRANARSGEAVDQVWLLDAIDFNASYSNIDTLSDFAMLVVDIEVRIGDCELAREMIKDYLELTRQRGSEARAVLDYYLFEKAIVGAAVSVLDEHSPAFSRIFLDVARKHAASFARQVEELIPMPV